MFMKMSKVLTNTAIMKYTNIGLKDPASYVPYINVRTILTRIINKPDTAVPTVNLDTTSWER